MTGHDWLGKVIFWELCKKLKFDHTNEWCMHNPESVLENEMPQRFWDFEIHIGWPNLGQTTRPSSNQQEKCELAVVEFATPANHKIKLKEMVKKDKYQNLKRKLKRLRNMKGTVISIIIGALDTITKYCDKDRTTWK